MQKHRKFPHKRPHVLLVQAWWSRRFLEGVARYATEHHWILDCEMGWTGHLPERWRGDGIIAYADRDPAIIKFVKNCRVPIVDISTFGDYFNAPKVVISNELIAREAVRHLTDLGFRHIACVHSSDHPVDLLRHECFEKEILRTGNRFYKLEFASLARQLKHLPRPVGLLATADHYAAKIIRACKDAGYAVPEDFPVVSVNNTPILCELTSTPITSVDPDFERNGYDAAATLDRIMAGKSVRKCIVTPPKGISFRRSTDTICIPDPDTAKALRYLRDHFLEPLSIGDVSRATSIPLRKIQANFRKFTGRTMVQEVARLRLAYASDLLRDPDYKIERVAHESGFSNRTYFVRAFRKYMKMTPKAYRKKALQEITGAEPQT